MKYRTFRNLVLTGAVLVVAGGVAALFLLGSDEKTADAPKPVRPLTEAKAASGHESYLTGLLGKPAGSGAKQKDALGKGGPKVNVYEEGGIWARAKVDLDRDEKWDEKWELKDGRVHRRISPTDDEQYTEERVLGGEGSATVAATPASPSSSAAASGLAPHEERIRARLAARATRKVKDLLRGQGPKVNLYADNGKRWSRAKVDLDRDGKWDEKWTIFPDRSVEKKVAPADDERYTKTYSLTESGWQLKR